MKNNIKKITIFLSIPLLFSIIIYKTYKKEPVKYKELYIIQTGAYKNYDNVVKNTKNLNNYIVYNEDDLYKIFIGLTLEEEVFNKLQKYYGENHETYKKTINITDKEFIKKISEYDRVIKNSNNKNNLNIIIKEELKLLDKFLNKKV